MLKLGIELIRISALFFVSRYIAAAIYMGPGMDKFSPYLFDQGLDYVGSELKYLSWLFGFIGFCLVISHGLNVDRNQTPHSDD